MAISPLITFLGNNLKLTRNEAFYLPAGIIYLWKLKPNGLCKLTPWDAISPIEIVRKWKIKMYFYFLW